MDFARSSLRPWKKSTRLTNSAGTFSFNPVSHANPVQQESSSLFSVNLVCSVRTLFTLVSDERKSVVLLGFVCVKLRLSTARKTVGLKPHSSGLTNSHYDENNYRYTFLKLVNAEHSLTVYTMVPGFNRPRASSQLPTPQQRVWTVEFSYLQWIKKAVLVQ